MHGFRSLMWRGAVIALAAVTIAGCSKKSDKKKEKVGTKKLVQKTPLEPKKRDTTPAPQAQLDSLLTAMSSEHAAVRLQAVRTFSRLAERAVAAAPKLIELLADKRPGVRLSATTALSYVVHPDAVEPLRKLRKDTDAKVATQALTALAAHDDRDELPAVIAELAAENPRRRVWAANTLGRWTERNALPALEKALTDKATPVKWAAMYAVGQYKDPSLASLLIPRLDGADRSTARQIGHALRGLLEDGGALPADQRAALVKRLDAGDANAAVAVDYMFDKAGTSGLADGDRIRKAKKLLGAN